MTQAVIESVDQSAIAAVIAPGLVAGRPIRGVCLANRTSIGHRPVLCHVAGETLLPSRSSWTAPFGRTAGCCASSDDPDACS